MLKCLLLLKKKDFKYKYFVYESVGDAMDGIMQQNNIFCLSKFKLYKMIA